MSFGIMTGADGRGTFPPYHRPGVAGSGGGPGDGAMTEHLECVTDASAGAVRFPTGMTWASGLGLPSLSAGSACSTRLRQ